MSSQTLLATILLIQIFHSCQSDDILFDQGFIKFVRHGRRQSYSDVEHIDEKIVPGDKTLVMVKTSWMETLHPQAVRNLRNLQVLFMVDCAVQKVEPGAFFNLPNLTVLHLQDNLIRQVKKGVFNELQVKILSLHRNQIKIIDTEAFDNMPNLVKIKLNSNRLKSWDSGWFKNTPRLTELYFRRNKLNYLPPRAFANLKTSHLVDGKEELDTKIFLSKNKLGGITPESFDGLQRVSQLYLDRNRIEHIPEGAFRDLEEIHVMYLARNKISEIKQSAFPKIEKIGILDLSNNLLTCLPYELVTLSNVTNLDKNNGTCDCAREFKLKLKKEKRSNEISYEETCSG